MLMTLGEAHVQLFFLSDCAVLAAKKLPKGDGSGGGPSGRGREGVDIGQENAAQGAGSGSCCK